MKSGNQFLRILVAAFFSFFLCENISFAQSTLPCGNCHNTQKTLWLSAKHASTQDDVASELAANWKGLPPDSVIKGASAENCVACHGPTAVAVSGGMSEVQVMSHFFTTTAGLYSDSTRSVDTANWPHVACVACHDVPSDHPNSMPTLSSFNSSTGGYEAVQLSSSLCGKCHGTLRFADTDHRAFDAWRSSKHGHGGQFDVAGELARSWVGQPPDSVINGSQAENCVACHAPTAVDRKSGITEVQVLARYFTTAAGVFTGATAPADTTHWPEVGCTTCHNPHKPNAISFFNTTIGDYQELASSDQLCGQCHGRLRFADTDHGTYDVELGTGGMGVPNKVTMPGVQCTDCHMLKSDADGTNSQMYKGHSWSVFIREPDGTTTTTCTHCHAGMSADSAGAAVSSWKEEFCSLDSIAQARVAAADSFMSASKDTAKLAYLAEAQHNLQYAQLDEGGGVHNHLYTVSLLNEAIQKAGLIVTGIGSVGAESVPAKFELDQNYPNPFNPSTTIRFTLPKEGMVEMSVFNVMGQKVATALSKRLSAGEHTLTFDGSDLPSGVYFYQINAGEYVETKKMTLIK